jgi:prepilin signal peptidase PulO-like enzyme (type II secretory pathway)
MHLLWPILGAGVVASEIAARLADANLGRAEYGRMAACDHCGATRRAWASSSVLGWVSQRGVRPCCRNRLDLLSTLGSVLVLGVGVCLALGDVGGAHPIVATLVELACTCLLVAAAVVDARHLFFPDSLVTAALAAALGAAVLRGVPFSEALRGLAIGLGGTAALFVYGPRLVGRPPTMGWGDAKVLGVGGALFGWVGPLAMLFAVAVLGGAFWGVCMALGVRRYLPPPAERHLAALRRLADAGDAEARKALEEDPIDPESADPPLATGPFYVLALMGLFVWRAVR